MSTLHGVTDADRFTHTLSTHHASTSWTFRGAARKNHHCACFAKTGSAKNKQEVLIRRCKVQSVQWLPILHLLLKAPMSRYGAT